MRFALLAATLASVIASGAPEAPDAGEYQKASYYRRVKDPNVRARYKSAMDKCKGHSNEKKRYSCFKRNWDLFKPHRQNKLNDLRARTTRACWKYKNNLLKRAKCFDKHIKDYKGELAKGLLADDAQHKEQDVQGAFQAAAEADYFDEDDETLLAMDHVNERELSSASSTDSEASSTSSDDTSDDNNHRAREPTNKKLASGERRAGRKERLAKQKKAAPAAPARPAAPAAAVKK
jgi:hypothetical protein